MYQAKVEIRQENTPGTFTIIDASTGDEIPLSREVIVRNGHGKSKTYLFDFTNEILIEGELQDYAYSIDYTAILDSNDTPSFGSTYTYGLTFLVSNHAEDYLLKLQKEIHCGTESCGGNKDLIFRSSEVIYYLQVADYYIKRCNAGKAQEALDYITDYIGRNNSSNCGCGCSH